MHHITPNLLLYLRLISEYLDLVMDDNPEKLEAKQGKLIPVLVKAIQELSLKVKALEAG